MSLEWSKNLANPKMRGNIIGSGFSDVFWWPEFRSAVDFKHTLRIIQNGGKKAKAWLKEKIVDTKFALPALYYPESLMPLEFWQACPTTTNGNEQAHRSINRDGTNLTLLAGIMRGQEYDERAATSINVHMEYGINSRDQPSTHNFRALRSVSRHAYRTVNILRENKHPSTRDETRTAARVQAARTRGIELATGVAGGEGRTGITGGQWEDNRRGKMVGSEEKTTAWEAGLIRAKIMY
ncbi:hypothetical protein EV363DRAFT_1297817 [Boletus edulis]|nr:hypothetical protein EV363DRAFT_1297817 [Boletus edulis]